MPSPSRRRQPPPRTGLAAIAGEAAHAINNALGLLVGAEFHLAREAKRRRPAAQAEAIAYLADATAKLQLCADALHLLAQRGADLRIPCRSPADALPRMLHRLCAESSLALRWHGDLPRAAEIAADGELVRWLVSSALASLFRGTPRDGAVTATVRATRGTIALELRATGAAAASAGARPNLAALALEARRAPLARAGLRVRMQRTAGGRSVNLRLPMASGTGTGGAS